MRKPRKDSRLKNLPEPQQAQLAEWCDSYGLEGARARALSETGLTTSVTALSGWYNWYHLRARLSSAAVEADNIRDILRTLPDISDSQIAAASQLLFEQRALAENDTKAHVALSQVRHSAEQLALRRAELAQKTRNLDLAERRVRLLEDNAAKAKLALETLKTKGGLTAETLATIEQAAGLL